MLPADIDLETAAELDAIWAGKRASHKSVIDRLCRKRYGNVVQTVAQLDYCNIGLSMSAIEGGGARTQVAGLILRCECGVTISARGQAELVEKTREHYLAAHPDLGADIPAELILAMAEEEVHL